MSYKYRPRYYNSSRKVFLIDVIGLFPVGEFADYEPTYARVKARNVKHALEQVAPKLPEGGSLPEMACNWTRADLASYSLEEYPHPEVQGYYALQSKDFGSGGLIATNRHFSCAADGQYPTKGRKRRNPLSKKRKDVRTLRSALTGHRNTIARTNGICETPFTSEQLDRLNSVVGTNQFYDALHEIAEVNNGEVRVTLGTDDV